MQALTATEIQRYSRHFPVIGIEGQQKLKAAKVLCIGAGGLGCPALQYLAAAGVGFLGIADGDRVDLSNLQRQVLFTEADLGRLKAEVVVERLSALNSAIVLKAIPTYIEANTAKSLLEPYDIILDATDNFEARYLINDACRSLSKPLISASIFQFDAQVSIFNYPNGPCYQCLYPTPPAADHIPNCALGGVLGVLPGVAGALQATEALKLILGIGQPLSGQLLCFDLLNMRFRMFEIPRADCSSHPEIKSDITCQHAQNIKGITPRMLAKWLADKSPIQLLDVRQPYERDICQIGGTHIPLPLLNAQLGQLSKDLETVVYCKGGVRSLQACQLLQAHGFSRLNNLEGGILRWIDEVDNSLTRY